MDFAQLLEIDFDRGAGHEVRAAVVFGEGDDFADALGADGLVDEQLVDVETGEILAAAVSEESEEVSAA